METITIHCSVCGHVGPTSRGEHRSAREAFRCANCRCSLRYRDQASLILDEFGKGLATNLEELATCGLLDDIRIYEAAFAGPYKRRLQHLPHYVSSYFFEDVKPGESKEGIRCEDLTQLTFEPDSFELVITSDIFEHVFNAQQAFREIHRVLAHAGVHIFTIPIHLPIPEKSVDRAILENGKVKHLLEPVYHRAGDGSDCLVVTDWGKDLFTMLSEIGFKTRAIRRSNCVKDFLSSLTFVSQKI